MGKGKSATPLQLIFMLILAHTHIIMLLVVVLTGPVGQRTDCTDNNPIMPV